MQALDFSKAKTETTHEYTDRLHSALIHARKQMAAREKLAKQYTTLMKLTEVNDGSWHDLAQSRSEVVREIGRLRCRIDLLQIYLAEAP